VLCNVVFLVLAEDSGLWDEEGKAWRLLNQASTFCDDVEHNNSERLLI